ncbi:RNA polymerase sigma factor [Carboxylicivirga caseinilyticus]|uniref:RNA polymerase sigma factor n=1 Tax=Carboxylicivirga caseinilyticus TaxID=3417572 RepID=UPI003D34BB61|nr:RNA polymerase sigma factor [Marinilabiliaceae bacterium A049]
MIEDRLLVKQVKEGNKDAFRQLVTVHHRRVIHICMSFVNQLEDAEDVAQEVFIEVFKSISNYREESSLSTWLYRLSVNKSLDYLRQKKRKKRGYGLLTSIDNDEMANLSVVDAGDASEEMEEEERRKVLLKAMDKLPERQRVALTLSKLDELPQKEVADIMGVSEGSVESLLVRAKKKLKEILLFQKEEIF